MCGLSYRKTKTQVDTPNYFLSFFLSFIHVHRPSSFQSLFDCIFQCPSVHSSLSNCRLDFFDDCSEETLAVGASLFLQLGNGRIDGGLELALVELGRQVFLQEGSLRQLLVGQILTLGIDVLRGRVATLCDSFLDDCEQTGSCNGSGLLSVLVFRQNRLWRDTKGGEALDVRGDLARKFSFHARVKLSTHADSGSDVALLASHGVLELIFEAL